MALDSLDSSELHPGGAGRAQVSSRFEEGYLLCTANRSQELVELMLSGVYADLQIADPSSGLSIWLHACIVAQPEILRMLASAGCDISETYVAPSNRANEEGYISGWSCLFFVVLHASWPASSAELEALQFLIKAGADPFLRDVEGHTIFDYVEDEKDPKYGSYRRELWYSALEREHVHVDRPAGMRQETPAYAWRYTPLHHRALCRLESWERDSIETQVARVLEDFPWTQEEEETIFRIAREKSLRH